MRVLFVLALPILVVAADRTFELRGRIDPPRSAVASLHSTSDAFADRTDVGPDGHFRFRKLAAGSYTLSVSVVGHGETRTTVHVGPATADGKGRVHVQIDRSTAHVEIDRVATVNKAELAIPEKAWREYAAAEKRLSVRDVGGARQHYLRAVEIAPQFSSVWNNLGTMSYKTGDYAQAESYFRRALEADPESYEPLVNLGGVLVSVGRLADARDVNLRAVARKPKDPLAHSQLGLAYLRLNQLTPAETHLKVAAELDPKHFSAPQWSLAEVYARRDMKAEAAEQLEELLRHHPNWPDKAKLRDTIKIWSSGANRSPN